MKKIFFTAFIFFAFISQTFSQTTILNLTIKNRIDSLYRAEQNSELDIEKAMQRNAKPDSIDIFEKLKAQTIKRNITILKKIIKDYGYPTYEKVGEESSILFFTLIEHSEKDLKFQDGILKLIRIQVDNKQIYGLQYAMLYDKVQLRSGKMQLYGTKIEMDKNGSAFAPKLLDKENVNKRRADIGLRRIEEDLKMFLELHATPIQKID